MIDSLELDGIIYTVERSGRRGLTLAISRNGTRLERLTVNPHDIKDRTLAIEALTAVDATVAWGSHLRQIALSVDGGAVTGERPFEVLVTANLTEPPPLAFRIEGLAPEGYPANIYGDGGQGKSLLGVAAGTAVAAGKPFLDLRTIRGPVLYLDYELDPEEFTRRAYRVARGMDMERPPIDLLYANVSLPLLSIRADIENEIRTRGVEFLLVDSLGPACGGNPSAPELVIPTMQMLRDLRKSSIILDHQSKLQQGQDYSAKTPYGSAYKGNLARSVWQMERGENRDHNLDILMSHRKANFGPLLGDIGIRITFDGPTVYFERTNPGDIASLVNKLPAKKRVLAEIREQGSGTVEQLVEATGLPKGTVQNALTELKKNGLVVRDPDAVWRENPESQSLIGRDSGFVSETASDCRAEVLTLAESHGWPQEMRFRHADGNPGYIHLGREDHWREWVETASAGDRAGVMEALRNYE